MTVALAAAFLIAVAALIYLQRRPLAEMQALIVGGSMGPGCVVAESVLLVILAAAIVFAYMKGLI